MSSQKNADKSLEAKLDQVRELLERLVAISMYVNGAAKQEIAKNLEVRRSTVDGYLKGIKVDKQK